MTGRPEPVIAAASLTAATTALIQVAFLWQLIPIPEGVDAATAQATLTAAVSAVVGLLSATWARGRVTPS